MRSICFDTYVEYVILNSENISPGTDALFIPRIQIVICSLFLLLSFSSCFLLVIISISQTLLCYILFFFQPSSSVLSNERL